MNPRTIIFLVVALVIAGGTGLLVKTLLDANRRPKTSVVRGPANEILVAKRGLTAGTFLTVQDVGWEPWPKSNIAKAYVHKGKRLKIPDFVGSIVRYGIAAGEPISEGRVVKRGERGFMAAVLSPGMRAIAIKAKAGIGASGFLFPGDRVDVVLFHSIKAVVSRSKARLVGETILENVRVLAVDQIADDSGKGKVSPRKNVTVELTPKQVEFLTVAERLGNLSFSLRSLGKTRSAEDPALDEEVDPGNPNPPRPAIRGRTHTGASEVSRLLDGESGAGNIVNIVSGTASKTAITSVSGSLR